MKWYVIGAVAILVIIAGAFFLLRPSPQTQTGTQAGNLFPTGTDTGGTGTNGGTGTTGSDQNLGTKNVATWNGGTVGVTNFLQNGATVQDPHNAGDYYLAGPYGASASDFAVIYYSDTGSFNIALTAEPIGRARKDAESFLEKTLGVTQDQMCQLKYYVGTTQYVNDIYGGESLGFSFCPGAVALPN